MGKRINRKRSDFKKKKDAKRSILRMSKYNEDKRVEFNRRKMRETTKKFFKR